MGSALSEVADGPISSTESTAGCQSETSRTTRTHLLCLSRAHNKFAIQLYQEFAKDGKRPGNFVICPISVSLGLGMLHLGSRGTSSDELNKILYLQEVQESQLLPAFAAMHWDVTRSTQPKGCVFEVAIRLFVQVGHIVPSQYEALCRRYDIMRIKCVDFRNRPDLARKDINQWTEERTHGRVRDVIPMGIVDRDTSLLLVCASYTKLQFLHPFEKKKTVLCPFYLSVEAPQIQMMYQRCQLKLAFVTKLDSDILELPLSNTHTKLYILLPRKSDGVNRMEMKLSRTVLETVLQGKLRDELVDLYLPKFRYELGIICWDALVKLGLKNLYNSGKADFSGLGGSGNLFLSRAFHHVCFELDEGQSDAVVPSSATDSNATTATDDAKQQIPKIFRADHPFAFFLMDERTGAISFIGRVVRPLQLTGVEVA